MKTKRKYNNKPITPASRRNLAMIDLAMSLPIYHATCKQHVAGALGVTVPLLSHGTDSRKIRRKLLSYIDARIAEIAVIDRQIAQLVAKVSKTQKTPA